MRSLAAHLPDFGAGRAAHVPARQPAESVESRLAEAERRGRAAGAEEARAAAAVALAAERAAFEQRLDAAREEWARQEGSRLADLLAEAVAALNADISDRVGRVLLPLVEAALRRKAIDELHRAIADLLADAEPPLRIGGPTDLVEPLRAWLSGRHPSASFVVTPAPEVTVLAGETAIESRLQAWAAHLRAALSEAGDVGR